MDKMPNNNNKLSSIQKDIINVRKKHNELESSILSQLENNNHSLNQFMKTLKTISYNQNVLENKLEDLMKNQMNTDILVNNINKRLNMISNLINTLNLSNKDINLLSSNNISDTTSTHKNNFNIVNGLDSSKKRGPGRPRKDQTKYINNNNNNNNSSSSMKNLHNNEVSSVKGSLPKDNIKISKSKRYFIDPMDSNDSSKSPLHSNESFLNNKSKDDTLVSTRRIKTRGRIRNYTEEEEEEEKAKDNYDDDESNIVNNEEEEEEEDIKENNKNRTNSNTTKQKAKTTRKRKNRNEDKQILIKQDTEFSVPQKRKRGRPPKLRTVETVILSASSKPNKKNSNADKQSPLSQQQKFNDNDTNNIDNTTMVDQTISNISTSNDNNPTFKDLIDENRNDEDNSKLKTILTNKITTANNNNGNSPISTQMTKRIPFKPDNENEKNTINKNEHDEYTNDKLSQENEEQQRKLDRLRDSREKMLTSLKYNDRARAKSFMESNKELLMALKLEERRKRLSSNYEHTLPVSNKQTKSEQNDNNDKQMKNETNDLKPMNKDQSNESNLSNIEKMQEVTTKKNKSKMNDKQDSNDTTTKIDEEKSYSDFSEESISNIANQKLVDDSTDHTLFDEKKTDLSNLLNSDADFSKDKSETENITATKPNLQSKLIETQIKTSNKKPLTSDTALKSNTEDVEINHAYNLRTKRKLTGSNIAVFSNTTEESSIDHTTKKARTSTSNNLKENKNNVDLEKYNVVNKTKNDVKDMEIDTSLDTRSVSDDSISDDAPLHEPIELVCKNGFFYNKGSDEPITSGVYLKYKFKGKEKDLLAKKSDIYENGKCENYTSISMGSTNKYDKTSVHILQNVVEQETEFAYRVLSKTTLTESYVNSLEYFIMEFRWENKLVGLGLKLSESKRTWQRRKALFTLFDFWRDQSIEKRNFPNFTMLHAIKEMENYRIFINRSVSWFYNHITLLKMILYDLCDNVDTQWRDWMFPKDKPLPVIGGYDEATKSVITAENINAILDKALVFDLLDDGTENNEIKQSQVVAPKVKASHEI